MSLLTNIVTHLERGTLGQMRVFRELPYRDNTSRFFERFAPAYGLPVELSRAARRIRIQL